MSDSVPLCGKQFRTRVFTHYAYGDPLAVNARYVSENGSDIWIFLGCQREAGHSGEHLADGRRAWSEPTEREDAPPPTAAHG